jgi:sigma-B regulation protein RsbU (phosphoserine phosphatase)
MTQQESKKQLELDSLIEFSQLINSNLNLSFILGNILLSIMGKMLITKGMVMIKQDTSDGSEIYTIESSKGIPLKDTEKQIQIELPKEPVFCINEINEKDKPYFESKGLLNFFKIYFDKKLIGVLCLGKKVSQQDGTEPLGKNEIIFLETLLNLSASSIENTIKFNEINRLNSSLSNKVNQLKSLFELGKEFNSTLINRDKIMRLLSYTLLGNFGIKDFLIISKYRSENFKLLNEKKNIELENFDLTELEDIVTPTIISEHAQSEFIKYLAQKDYVLMVPTFNNGKLDNIICLGRKLNKSGFTKEDMEFLESIINLSVISIENSILFEEYLEKQQIENELKIAREIQVALLPESLPIIAGYQLSADNIPALQVGGDYYDVIKLTDTKFAFVIADVSGKGTPASILMSNIQSAVHSYLKLYTDSSFDIGLSTRNINELIYENTTPEKFITFFWGILDTENSEFEYINAGHNHPYLFRDREVIHLDKGGLMVGIMTEGVDYEVGTIKLEENDVLVMYTDGVNEAQNVKQEEYGDDRLISLVSDNLKETAGKISIEIKKSLDEFVGIAKQFDDITLIVIKKKAL